MRGQPHKGAEKLCSQRRGQSVWRSEVVCAWRVLEWAVGGDRREGCLWGRMGSCKNPAFYLRCNGIWGLILLAIGVLKVLEQKGTWAIQCELLCQANGVPVWGARSNLTQRCHATVWSQGAVRLKWTWSPQPRPFPCLYIHTSSDLHTDCPLRWEHNFSAPLCGWPLILFRNWVRFLFKCYLFLAAPGHPI